MPAARYWRLVGVRPWGTGALSITEAALYTDTARADQSATLSASLPPSAGSLAFLQDGSAANAVSWTATQLRSPGWNLTWDFGTATEIVAVAIGGAASKSTYPSELRLEFSDDGANWSVQGSARGLIFPGAFTLGSAANRRTRIVEMNFNDGSISDAFGHTVNVFGGPYIASSTPLIDGTPYLQLSGADYLELPNTPDLSLGDNYEIGFDLRLPPGAGASGGAIWHHGFYDSNSLSWTSRGISIRVLDSSIRFYFFVDTNATEQYVDVAYTTNTAQRWRMVRSGTDGFVYRDGVQVATISGLNSMPAPTRQVQIGRWAFSAANPTMVGQLDNLVVFGSMQIAEVGSDRLVPTTLVSALRPLAADAPVGPVRARRIAGVLRVRDLFLDGKGVISGTVKRDADPVDVPLHRRVRLHRERDGLLVRETWSDRTTGAYAFTEIDETVVYTVITYDYEHGYRAVIADNIVPEIMS